MLEVNCFRETYQIWLFFRWYENFWEVFKGGIPISYTKRDFFKSKFEEKQVFLPLVFVFTVVTGFTQKSEVQRLILSRHSI